MFLISWQVLKAFKKERRGRKKSRRFEDDRSVLLQIRRSTEVIAKRRIGEKKKDGRGGQTRKGQKVKAFPHDSLHLWVKSCFRAKWIPEMLRERGVCLCVCVYLCVCVSPVKHVRFHVQINKGVYVSVPVCITSETHGFHVQTDKGGTKTLFFRNGAQKLRKALS